MHDNWPASIAIALYTVACYVEYQAGNAPSQKPVARVARPVGKLNRDAVNYAIHGRSFRRSRKG